MLVTTDVPFGMSLEDFNRLPDAARAALRAQAPATAHQVEAVQAIPTASGPTANLVQVGAPRLERPAEATPDSARQTSDEPSVVATELKSRQLQAIVVGIAAVLLIGVGSLMSTNR